MSTTHASSKSSPSFLWTEFDVWPLQLVYRPIARPRVVNTWSGLERRASLHWLFSYKVIVIRLRFSHLGRYSYPAEIGTTNNNLPLLYFNMSDKHSRWLESSQRNLLSLLSKKLASYCRKQGTLFYSWNFERRTSKKSCCNRSSGLFRALLELFHV